MRNHKMFLVLIAILSFYYFGCASSNVPSYWSANPDKMATDVFGGWVDIEYDSLGVKDKQAGGELIAISSDSIYYADSLLHSIYKNDIASARLISYNSNYMNMGLLTFLGSISTISNGWFLGITFPMWLIGGTTSTVTQSYNPVIDFPQNNFREFVPFARFPQGLPVGIVKESIKMKTNDK